MILISHDSYHVEACADKIMVVENAGVNDFSGDLNDYKTLVLSRKTGSKRKEKPAPKPKAKTSDGERKKLKTELAGAEAEVERLTKEIKKYNKALNNPRLYDKSDPSAKKALQQFTREKATLEASLESAEEHWMALEEKLG